MPRPLIRSLRWRFAIWFGLFFIVTAVANRCVHYLLVMDLLARDVDDQLWSRLADLKTQHRYAPQTLTAPGLGLGNAVLPDVRDATDRKPSAVLRLVMPAESRADPNVPSFPWFGGAWRPDGAVVATYDLPAGLDWDPTTATRVDKIWDAPDRSARLAATAAADGTILLVGTPLDAVVKAARQTLVFEAATLVAVLVPTLAVAWLLVSRLLGPLGRITDTARRIRAGRFEERIDVQGIDVEVVDTAMTINGMLDRLDAVRVSQSRLNADVAHQVLNPVHAIMLETDVSMQQPRSRDELEATVADVHGQAERIQQLCESLLTYARSQAIEPADLEPIDVEPIVCTAADRVSAIAADRGVAVDVAATSAVVRGGSQPLEEVFVNLLANAIQHSPRGDRVTIGNSVAAGRCVVAVVDRGPGIAAAVLSLLFSRHFRGTSSAGGHGLGLAICKGIVEQHGGTIDYRDTPGGGATFEVRLPLDAPPAGCSRVP
ncbi:MAG: ATP-binding protein [Planctomycetota bacterium]